MRQVILTESELITLETGFTNHPKAHARKRFHALLLSHRGWKVKQIAQLYNVRTRTVYTWMNRWETMGLVGLLLKAGRGLKPTLSVLDETVVQEVKKKALEFSRSLKTMAKELSQSLQLTISSSKLRRFLKKLGYSWKRFRKSLHKLQDKQAYNAKLSELKQLIQLEQGNYIDLFYADATGFSQTGNIPYGWQPKHDYITLTPEKGKTLQVFGFMSKDNRFEGYTCLSSLNSAVVIAFIDDYVKKIRQKTVVVIDNASIHHSAEFQNKIRQWEEQDVYIFYLPTYSPHLNPIEILWRKMKYEWIQYEYINTFEQLEEQVLHILNNFGKNKAFSIEFNEDLCAKQKVSNIFS